MADINISVALDSAKAEQSAKNLDDKLKGMGSSADAAKTPFDGLWKQIFAGVSVAAITGKAIKEFTDFIKGSITAAMEAEKVNAALKSALRTTGREADDNARHFIDYASSLQKATIYNDEAIKGAQTLLLQLTTLDRDGIDAATRGAIGLSSVLGIDLNSAALLVSKAMEGNTAALGRYGIKVKETGSAEEKRNELLEKLEGFYKRATDATDTFEGRLAQAKNTIDDSKEAIGRSLIPALANLLEKITPVIESLFLLGEAQEYANWAGDRLNVVEGKLWDTLSMAAAKAGITGKAWENLIDKYHGSAAAMAMAVQKGLETIEFQKALHEESKKGAAAIETWRKSINDAKVTLTLTDEWAKRFGITLKTTLIEQLNDTRAALDRLKKSGEATPGAIEALNKKIKDLETYLKGVDKPAAKVAATIKDHLVPAARNLNDVFAKTPIVVAQAYVKSVVIVESWAKKNKDAIQAVVAFSQQALGLLSSAYSSYYSNQMTKLDEESAKKQEVMDADYERRKKDIEDSTLSEEEKQKALAALDKEYKDAKEIAEAVYEDKKKRLQKEAAEKSKAVAIVQAIINTAEGVSKALTLLPPMSFIMAALVGTMGLAQIALIKSQAIPLAKGAMFDRPTLLVGGKYEVGEAGREAALPVEPLLKRIDAMILKGLALKGSGQVYVQVFIGQEELDKRIIKVTKREGNLGRLKLDSKVMS